ncbi:MAG: MFS transporter [Terriglobales bacterium]
MPSEPRSSSNVHAFGLTSFFNDTATEMAYWVLPAFLTSIGAGPATLGLIEGIAESVASFAKLFSGYWTDRLRRRKPLVVSGYAVANALKPLLAIATVWWQVLVIRFGDRLSKGIRGAPRDVMLAESVEPARLGSAYGLLQAMDSAGAIAGPLIALLLLSHVGLRGVFWAAAIPGLLAVVVVVLFVRETHAHLPSQRTEAAPLAKTALSATYYYVVFAVALFSLGNSSDMFLVLRAQSVGIGAAYAPLLGLVFNITYTAFSWPAGKLSDRIPRHLLVSAGYAVFAAVYCVFGLAPSHAAIWVMMSLYGAYYALTAPVLKGMVVDHAPRNARGRAFGIFYFVTSVAALLSSIVTGELWKYFGPRLPLLLSAGLAAIAAVLILFVPKRVNVQLTTNN